jgi:hypothetical protein
VVVDEKPARAVVDGKLAAVHPLALAEEIIVTLPDVVTDRLHHGINPLPEVHGLVARYKLRRCLHENPDGPVMAGGVGGMALVAALTGWGGCASASSSLGVLIIE